MEAGFDFFMCGLCNQLVQPMDYKDAPWAVQCVQCNNLFCEWCTNSQMMWQCPGCKCKSQPEHIHYKVKEILEQIKIYCPGCKKPFKYADMQKHMKEDECGRDARKTEAQMQELIVYNL
jgi:hypothetical protein